MGIPPENGHMLVPQLDRLWEYQLGWMSVPYSPLVGRLGEELDRASLWVDTRWLARRWASR